MLPNGRGSPPEPRRDPLAPVLPWIALLVLLFAWRAYLIREMPTLFSWDAFARVWEKEQLVVRHWLPIPQLPVYVWSKTELGLGSLRLAYALIGSAAAVAAGVFVSTATRSRRSGIICGALIGAAPLFVKYTTVPYQEGAFILFAFLGVTLWGLQRERSSGGQVRGWMAGTCLALGVLSRYEGWLLVAILAVSSLLSKRTRELAFLAPAAVAMGGWIATASARSSLDGPPRSEEAMLQLLERSDNLGGLLSTGLDAVGWLLAMLAVDLLVVGIAGAALGIWIGLVGRRRWMTRELVVLLVATLALAVIRVLNAGVPTDRMRLLPIVLLLVTLGFAWDEVTGRLRGKGSQPLFLLIPITMLGVFASHGLTTMKSAAQTFHPEARAARLLESLPSDVAVEIRPRDVPNILSESSVGSIFAQSVTLEAGDSRWTYEGGQSTAEDPDLLLFWAGREYRLRDLATGETLEP